MSPESEELAQSASEPSSVTIVAPSPHFLTRIFGRSTMDMGVLLLVAFIFSGLVMPEVILADPDIWWHLADARILTEAHHFIHLEPYSFTVAGQPWVDPEWLSELIFWLGYKAFGLVGIYIATLLGLSANVLFLYWRSFFRSRHGGVALWTGLLAVLLMTVNASARTILFAYLALSVEMAILEAVERGKSRMLWLLPPLFCIWINLHGSWIIGMSLLVLFILSGLFRVSVGMFEQEAFLSKDRNRLVAVLATSLCAIMINPYGWHLVWNPFDMAFNQSLNIASVQEWQPLNLGWFVGKAAAVAIALTILTNAIHQRKWKIFELALLFFAWYAAFDHARFTFMAAVLTIPLITADIARGFFPSPNPKTIPAINALLATGALCVIAWYFPSQSKLEKGMAKELPLQTIALLQPTWRTFNQESLGGLMDFEYKPTFIDTRWDIFEHKGVMKDFMDVIHFQDSLRILDKYSIDHVLLRNDQPLAYLLQHTQGWTVVHREQVGQEQYLLFARNTWTAPPNPAAR